MSATEASASCTSDSEGSCGKASPPAQALKGRTVDRMTAGDEEIIDGSIPLHRYINIVREKDDRIRKLEQENKRLKTVLSEKTTEFRARIDELVQELDRHAELVDRLQTQLADFEVTRTATKDFQKSLTSDAVFVSNAATVSQNAIADPDLLLQKIPVDADEICAALSSFVEKNKRLGVSNDSSTAYGSPSDKKSKSGSSSKNVIIEQQPITEVVGMGKVDASVFSPSPSANIWTSIDTTAKACEMPDEVNPSNLLALLFETTTTPKVEPTKKETPSGGTKPKAAHTPAPPKEQTEEEARIVDAMQKRIAQNVSRLGGRPLNTTKIALECKRLMTAYNVGQRLFAKAVMNQVVKSQGSLSELLSKPRQWNKLTDKGREAFRRIFGWISDDKAIELLCQLSPRRLQNVEKVDHPTPESLLETDDTSSTPLPPPDYSQDITVEVRPRIVKEQEPSVAKNTTPVIAPSTAQLASPARTSRWRHDDIPKEKIIELFEAEKAKLKEQESHLERAMSGRSLSPSPSRYSTDSSGARKPYDPQRSLSPNSVGSTELLPCPVIGKWRVEPIVQEQLEKHPVLDTEEIVRQVKDYLNRHSVSQRQFGENVLGLSQGSVSDLLARPKTWNQLTHKGREPFIRMKLFLDECKRHQRYNPDEHSMSESSFTESELPTCNTNSAARVVLMEVKTEPPSEMVDQEEDNPVDTAEVARRVKETISRQGISLKVLGENVLGITASEVCELLTRPKPWADVPIKNREPYRRLLEVITDDREIARLKELEERAAAMRNAKDIRRAPVEEAPVPSVVVKRKIESGDDSSCESPNKKCPRFQRTIISDKQKEALLYVYSQEQRPSPKTIDQLALKLGLTSRTVTNWFHNHRTRQKAREAKLAGESVERPPTQCPLPGSPAPSDGWFKDIHELLRANSVGDVKASGSMPTMVPTSASNILKSISDQITAISEQQRDEEELEQAQGSRKQSTSTDGGHRPSTDGSQLDKAIARMHKLAASRK